MSDHGPSAATVILGICSDQIISEQAYEGLHGREYQIDALHGLGLGTGET